jgi:hypothetical protein
MKQAIIYFLLIISINGYSQGDGEYKEPSKESQAYHDYRMYESTPPYGLTKVKKLISQIKSKESDDGDFEEALDNKTFKALSLREKFTYTMVHAESFSQVCDAYPPALEEQTKIFGYLPDFLEEQNWSERQIKFLKDNRDSVMALIKESSIRSKRMGVNYKRAIQEINGVEMIPFLVKFYNEKKKDGDVLTLMMVLMKENKYEPFLSSTSYKKLYGEDYNFNAFIVYNKANEELIIKRATEFYNAQAK